jgi:hypothetical protein
MIIVRLNQQSIEFFSIYQQFRIIYLVVFTFLLTHSLPMNTILCLALESDNSERIRLAIEETLTHLASQSSSDETTVSEHRIEIVLVQLNVHCPCSSYDEQCQSMFTSC